MRAGIGHQNVCEKPCTGYHFGPGIKNRDALYFEPMGEPVTKTRIANGFKYM